MVPQTTVSSNDQLLDKLTNPTVSMQLERLIDQLPTITRLLDLTQMALYYTNETMADQTVIDRFVEGVHEVMDPIDKITSTFKPLLMQVKPVLSSPSISKLPVLVDEFVESAEAMSEVMVGLRKLSDVGVLSGLIKLGEAINSEYFDLILQVLRVFEQAYENANKDETAISLLDLLRMIKEPSTQKVLKTIRNAMKISS